jgi:hypothetical protein
MFESLRLKMLEVSQESLNVMNGIEKLEKKFEFLSCCKTELNQRMQIIKNELIKQSQRSKDLEQIFLSTLQKVLPNFRFKSFSFLDNEEDKINKINNLFNNVHNYVQSHKDISLENLQICSLNNSCGCKGKCHCKNQCQHFDNFCFCKGNCHHNNFNIIDELNCIEQIKEFNKKVFSKDNKIENILKIGDNKIYDSFDEKMSINNFSIFDKSNEKEFPLSSPSQTLLNFSFHSYSDDNLLGKKRNNNY